MTKQTYQQRMRTLIDRSESLSGRVRDVMIPCSRQSVADLLDAADELAQMNPYLKAVAGRLRGMARRKTSALDAFDVPSESIVRWTVEKKLL